jgi:Cu-Zn family superoxide dismutase
MGMFLDACTQPDPHASLSEPTSKAICVLYPAEGGKVTGIIFFEKVSEGIKVTVDIMGLTPGRHGFHIHEFGDCSAKDLSSAGSHFNPAMKSHGAPTDEMRHDGDMGNVVADESGKTHLEYIDRKITLDGENSIIGRAVIVHEKEDDLKTQPTGNAGGRIACGVIGKAKE